MRAIGAVVLMAAFLLAGCAADKAEPAGAGAQGAEAPGVRESAPPLPSTAGIMLERTAEGVMTDAAAPPGRETFSFGDVSDGEGRVIVYYFFSSGCSACKALRPEIDRLESECPDADWREYDLKEESGSWAYLDFAEQKNLSRQGRLVPQVLVNGTIITDRFEINGTLGAILASLGACEAGAAGSG